MIRWEEQPDGNWLGYSGQALVATATPTPTLAPSSTPTVGSGGGPPLGTIPTLSPGMLALLAIGLAAGAVLLIRRL